MVESRGELDLAEESLRAQGGRELGVEHLHRDRTLVPQVAAQEDRGSAPPPELPLDQVSLSQDLRQRVRGQSRQGGLWPGLPSMWGLVPPGAMGRVVRWAQASSG